MTHLRCNFWVLTDNDKERGRSSPGIEDRSLLASSRARPGMTLFFRNVQKSAAGTRGEPGVTIKGTVFVSTKRGLRGLMPDERDVGKLCVADRLAQARQLFQLHPGLGTNYLKLRIREETMGEHGIKTTLYPAD